MLRYALLGALLLAPMTAHAANPAIGDYSVVLTTTPALVLPLLPYAPRHIRECNVDPTNTAWLSRATSNPQPNAAGSFPLAPGACEEFAMPSFVPNAYPLYGVAASGTVQLTVEAF